MYKVYIGRIVVATFKDDEGAKAHEMERELKKTNEDVWVELL